MSTQLKATLNGWHLWGLAVGLVISGEYFGWSYGWDKQARWAWSPRLWSRSCTPRLFLVSLVLTT